MTCDECSELLSRKDAKWIRVHFYEYDDALLAIRARPSENKGGEDP